MSVHFALLSIGALFLLGLVADVLGRRAHVPRVTLLILAGLLIGPTGLDVLPSALEQWYEFLASAALTMVAFLLGGALSLDRLRDHGREIVIVSVAVVSGCAVIVGGGLWLMGVPVTMALLLAGISTATDPAATQDVVRQSGAKGRFSRVVLGIVAIDDAWGLIAFSLLLADAVRAEHYKVFLLAGQSNMSGRAKAKRGLPDELRRDQEDVLMWYEKDDTHPGSASANRWTGR